MQKRILGLLSFLICVLAMHAAAPSGSLPIMYINTDGGAPIDSKAVYVHGSYYLDPKGTEGVEAFGSAEAPLPLQIRGRGNFTWTGFEKKPYRLKLDKKAALFGESKSKHWALLAHADDNRGFLRNAVGFQLSRLIGLPWTPCHHPVEVVLNGDYIGLYFLTETVRVDSSRVNVWDYDSEYEDYAEMNPGSTLPWQDEYASGGWLVEIDNYDDEDQIKITSIDPYNQEEGSVMRITYDTPSDYISEAHKKWLENEFLTLDRMIVEGDRNACEWKKNIDLANLARFFIVNQIVFNYESFHGSCKLSRDKGADAKWNFGPVWDFGSAFQTDDVRHLFFDFGPYTNHWIKTMYEYPAFRNEVKRIYEEFRNGNYSQLEEYIDGYVAGIKAAAAADYQRWSHCGYGNNDMDGSRDQVKNMLNNSVNWLDQEWLGIEVIDPDPAGPATDIYLRGTINNWSVDPAYKFTKGTDGLYRLHLDHLEGEFKLAGPEWNIGNVDYGFGGGIELDTPEKLIFRAPNISLTDEAADDVTLIFCWEDKTLTISTGVLPDDDSYTVYFRNNSANPWEKVYVYTYLPELHGAWPGTLMEPVMVDGEALLMHRFKRVHEDGAKCVIFNNGGYGAGNQTYDLNLHDRAIYTINGDSGQIVSGIANVDADSDSPVEYYNLQGIRVNEPSEGIFIRRQGERSSLVKF